MGRYVLSTYPQIYKLHWTVLSDLFTLKKKNMSVND